MRVGDLIEWLAAGCFVASASLATGRVWPGVLTAAVCLAYFGQCYATHELKLKRPRLPRLRRKAEKA